MSAKTSKSNGGIMIKVLLFFVILGFIFTSILFYGAIRSHALGTTSKMSNPMSSLFKPKPPKEKFFKLNTFTIKIADGSYIQADVYLGYTGNKKADTELSNDKAVLCDQMITDLMTLKSTDFDSAHIEHTKAILAKEIQPYVHDGKITHVYFSSFIIQ